MYPLHESSDRFHLLLPQDELDDRREVAEERLGGAEGLRAGGLQGAGWICLVKAGYNIGSNMSDVLVA